VRYFSRSLNFFGGGIKSSKRTAPVNGNGFLATNNDSDGKLRGARVLVAAGVFVVGLVG
jgi:hypothetical protein